MRSEDQPVGPQRVLHGVRLAQELWIPGDLDRVSRRRRAAQPRLQRHRRTDRHGGLAYHQRGLGQQRCQRVDRSVQLTQVSGATCSGRCPQGQEMYVGPVRNLGVVGGEPEPSRGSVALQQRLEADFEDVRLAGIQRLDTIDVDVNPDHLMAEFRHTSGMGCTQIVRADHAHLQCHPQIFPQHGARRRRCDVLRRAAGGESTRSANCRRPAVPTWAALRFWCSRPVRPHVATRVFPRNES